MQRSFLHDGYAVGVGCVSATAGAKEGYRDTSRRSPTLVFTVANHCRCISVQIEHNSVGCHGWMYFDIVETTATMYKPSKPSPPQQDQDNKTTKWEGGEGVWQASHGSPMLAFPLFFVGGREIQRPVNNYAY